MNTNTLLQSCDKTNKCRIQALLNHLKGKVSLSLILSPKPSLFHSVSIGELRQPARNLILVIFEGSLLRSELFWAMHF